MGYLNNFSEKIILIINSNVIIVCQILLFLNNKLLWSIKANYVPRYPKL